MKRIYKSVTTQPVENGWGVALDGRPLRTPAKRELRLPNDRLAAAIAAEWDAQDPDIRPETMPLARLAATAIDHTAEKRAEIAADVASYAGTDLVCYRADHPPALVARQEAAWQPLIDWAAGRYDAGLAVTSGIVPLAQSPASLKVFAGVVATLDDFRLTALQAATAACGSLVIALALYEGRLYAEAAFAASQLDETFQIEAWGEDAEATQRRAALAADIQAAARFLDLLDASGHN
jgi:chaperone required for assembly of F1-ATPase